MRQLIAVFFYLLAGLFLLCLGVVAFLPAPDASWGGAMAVMAVLAFGPLAIAFLVSPGARVREAGIVLLVAGVLVALSAVTVAVVVLSPGFRELLPPDAAQDFSGFPTPIVGIGLAAAMVVGGLWMLIKGPGRPPSQ